VLKCWICQRDEVESLQVLMSDGAHRNCPRPQPAPNLYVEPMPVQRRNVGLNLNLKRKRKQEAAQ
jgi:hypothetical protein